MYSTVLTIDNVAVMHFTIDQTVCSTFPYIAIAWVRIQLRAEARANKEVMNTLKTAALEGLLTRVESNAELEQLAPIQEWFEGYRRMGLRPKKVKPTHYAFTSRLTKDRQWPRAIGPLVDAYLINQVKHVMPHGGFDVARLPEGGCDLSLIKSEVETIFQPLGVSEQDKDRLERTKPGEVIYQCIPEASLDEKPITLTRHLNYRDGERTKIFDDPEDESKSTKDFILLIESLDPSPEARERLGLTAEDLLQTYVKIYGQDNILASYVRKVAGGEQASTEEKQRGTTLSLDW